jgi:hypothetical protein
VMYQFLCQKRGRGTQRLSEPKGGYPYVAECDGPECALGVPDDQAADEL